MISIDISYYCVTTSKPESVPDILVSGDTSTEQTQTMTRTTRGHYDPQVRRRRRY